MNRHGDRFEAQGAKGAKEAAPLPRMLAGTCDSSVRDVRLSVTWFCNEDRGSDVSMGISALRSPRSAHRRTLMPMLTSETGVARGAK